MTASAGLNAITPLLSFLTAILIFGLFSWLHFFYSLIGTWLLSIAAIFMYVTWPLYFLKTWLFGESNFDAYSLIPLALCISIVALAWYAHFKKLVLPKKVSFAISIPSFLIAAYLGGYFVTHYFF
ncbi:MAG: hypothetical protein RH916_00005 [Vicingaceae bacterium]